jgi:GPH family glycoside/pentoside/hexuronide:cation symporter
MSHQPHVQKAASPTPAIPLAVAVGWGLGSLGMSAVFQAFSVLLLRFLTDYLGVAAATAGLLIGLSKLFDAVIDPLIGALSDRTRSRWGRRRPYLLLGGAVCAVTFALMFYIPAGLSEGPKIWLVEAVLMAFAAGYAFFNIPYLAMPAEMSDSPHERTSLISLRVGGVAIGSLAASFVGPLLIAAGGGGVAGHRVMGLAIAVVTGAASAGCFLMTAKARRRLHGGGGGHGMIRQFRMAFGNKAFTSLILVKIAQLLGAGVTFAITPYLFIQVMHAGYGTMGLYFLVFFLAMIAGQPFFVWACRRYGKKRVYLAAAAPMILVTLSWWAARPGEAQALIFARAAVLGFIGGSSLLVIQGMLPDTIQYDVIRTGLNREGVFAGVYTTIEKVASALASGLVGIILGGFGYVASTGHAVVQPASAILAIYLVAAAAPAALMALSCLLMLRYPLTEAMLLDPAQPQGAGGFAVPILEKV